MKLSKVSWPDQKACVVHGDQFSKTGYFTAWEKSGSSTDGVIQSCHPSTVTSGSESTRILNLRAAWIMYKTLAHKMKPCLKTTVKN